MNLLRTVKHVVDYNVRILEKSDSSAVDLANVKMSMNLFDEIAVKEVVCLKEAVIAIGVFEKTSCSHCITQHATADSTTTWKYLSMRCATIEHNNRNTTKGDSHKTGSTALKAKPNKRLTRQARTRGVTKI